VTRVRPRPSPGLEAKHPCRFARYDPRDHAVTKAENDTSMKELS
jgi:hypothetical protein